jgi:hypothetical protein
MDGVWLCVHIGGEAEMQAPDRQSLAPKRTWRRLRWRSMITIPTADIHFCAEDLGTQRSTTFVPNPGTGLVP